MGELPRGVGMHLSRERDPGGGGIPLQLWFRLVVHRDTLFDDTVAQLVSAYVDDPGTLALPLRVEFVGEEAMDHGGVSKELFTLLVKKLVELGILQCCGNGRFIWFSGLHYDHPSLGTVSICFVVGMLISLAAHNSVLINFPIPPSIYKIIAETKVNRNFLYKYIFLIL